MGIQIKKTLANNWRNTLLPGQSIFARLFWSFITSSLLIILLAGYLYYDYAKKNTGQHFKEQLDNSLQEVTALFEKGYQTRIESGLSMLETSPSLENFLTAQSEEAVLIRFDIEKQFSQLIHTNQELYHAIQFVDAFGKEAVVVKGHSRIRKYSSIVDNQETHPEQSELKTLFKKLKKGQPKQIIFSSPYRNKQGHIHFYAGIAKLEPEIGGFGGAVIFECDIGGFISRLNTVRIHGRHIIWLLDANNEIIFRPEIFKGSRDPRPALLNEINKKSERIIIQNLYAGSTDKSHPFLRLILNIPPEILAEQNLVILRTTLFIAAIAILFTMVVALLVSQQITSPIRSLVHASHKIACGDFNSHSNINDKSEIGLLSRAFNRMTENLRETMQSRNKELSIRIAAEEALHQSHDALEMVLNSTGEGIFGFNMEGKCTFCNNSALSILGYLDEGEISGKDMHDILQHKHPDNSPYERKDSSILSSLQTKQQIHRDDEVFVRADSQIIPVEYRAHPVIHFDEMTGVVVSFTDISARRQAESQLRTLSQAVAQSPVSVILTNPHGIIEFINDAVIKNSGPGNEQLVGQHILSLFHGTDTESDADAIWHKATNGQASEGIIHSKSEDKQDSWAQVYISPVSDNKSQTISYMVLMEDITERTQQEKKITHQAHHDMLTGLPNRFLAMDRLNQLLSTAKRYDRIAAVLFIDLDGFKKVNDLLGHEMGDKLLIEAARRLKKSVREQDTVGRLGGDEFIVLLGDLLNEVNAQRVAESILATFREPFQTDEHELVLTASIGIAIYPADGENASSLLRNADISMYESKTAGRNTYHFFTEELNAGIQRRLEVEEQLHHALARNEFYLLYQPILDIDSLNLVGAETLLRWKNDKLGSIFPDEFIPIAEQTGLISSIGEFVLQESIKQSASWKAKVSDTFKISVNVSPRQFHSTELHDFIVHCLNHSRLNAENLQLELTEGVLMTGHKQVEQMLHRLHSAGIKIAMDDFGTGYSSLSYLRKYPFDSIKIDRSFVSDIHHDPGDRELVLATLNMARALGLKVVAEGIETSDQLDFLRQHGCDYGQGYLFSKPLLYDDFEALFFDSDYKAATAWASFS